MGSISGADAVLAGDIVIFGRDDKKTNIGAGGFARGPFAGIHIKKEEDKAVVAIDYRLIDAETSEVIATGEARGESTRKSSGLGGMGGVWGAGGGGGGIDMTSSNFGQTIIGEATQDCVNKLADILKQQTTTMKKAVREVEGRVADVSGNTLVINVGSDDGVNVGETFEILRIVREVKDPGDQGNAGRGDRKVRRNDHHQRARQNRHRKLHGNQARRRLYGAQENAGSTIGHEEI